MSIQRKDITSLGGFLELLESRGQLIRVTEPVSTVLEMTEIQTRLLAAGGPAVLFERPVMADGRISEVPVLANLFGTVERTAWGLGCEPSGLRALGEDLAFLKQPKPIENMREAVEKFPQLKAVLAMKPGRVKKAPVQAKVFTGDEIDLNALPIMTCWPGEPAPLITWPLVITRPPGKDKTSAYNLGVYRMQVRDRRSTIMRWLAHRGGAQHHRQWAAQGEDMPVAVAIGADPGTILAAVTPIPDNLSEYHYAGLLRKKKLDLVDAKTVPLKVPAEAEIILEGTVSAHETAAEGPYGDHTGYYNSVERFPVFNLTAITMRDKPVYLSTFTGRPPDEPSVIGEALNEVFIPLLQQQFPEITDFWLPPEGCSYRIGVVAIKKKYPGHARRIMMGLWSWLAQFSYTKFLIVVDDDIDARNWQDIMWAVSTRSDAARDLMVVENTPIDYLDFASPQSGLGGKLGIDATNKMGAETAREWGQPIAMDADVIARVDGMWAGLGLPGAGRDIWSGGGRS